jgi:MFS family permease
VLSRFLQGMGGAMMTPVGRLVLVRSTEKSDLVNAMAWLTIPALIGPLAGAAGRRFPDHLLLLALDLPDQYPDRVAGVIFALTLLPAKARRRRCGRVDWTGFMLAGAAASGIVFGLSVISLPALPPAGAYPRRSPARRVRGYVRSMRGARRSAAQSEAVRQPTFRAAIIGANLFRIGAGAVPFLLPLMLQLGFG